VACHEGNLHPAAMLLEATMTAVLVLVLLLLTSSARTARWTALVLWPVIAGLVWQGAPYTATSLDPARRLGPALLAPLLGPYWVYVAGPLLGVAVAVAGFALLRDRRVLTAKLFHDPRYRSTLGTSLAVWAAAADRVGSEPASVSRLTAHTLTTTASERLPTAGSRS